MGPATNRRACVPCCSWEDMVMRVVDFVPFCWSSIGFDRLFEMVENVTRVEKRDDYPPYNIEEKDTCRVTLAVAGFSVISQSNRPVVAGKKVRLAKQNTCIEALQPGHSSGS